MDAAFSKDGITMYVIQQTHVDIIMQWQTVF